MIPKVKTSISAKEESKCKQALKNSLSSKTSGRKFALDSPCSTHNSTMTIKCSWLVTRETWRKWVKSKCKDLTNLTIGSKTNMERMFNHLKPLLCWINCHQSMESTRLIRSISNITTSSPSDLEEVRLKKDSHLESSMLRTQLSMMVSLDIKKSTIKECALMFSSLTESLRNVTETTWEISEQAQFKILEFKLVLTLKAMLMFPTWESKVSQLLSTWWPIQKFLREMSLGIKCKNCINLTESRLFNTAHSMSKTLTTTWNYSKALKWSNLFLKTRTTEFLFIALLVFLEVHPQFCFTFACTKKLNAGKIFNKVNKLLSITIKKLSQTSRLSPESSTTTLSSKKDKLIKRLKRKLIESSQEWS